MHPIQYVYRPKGRSVWWWRRVVPERLRPVLPLIEGFEDIPNRINLKISLGTEDVRVANGRALAIQARVDAAFDQAVKLLDGAKAVRMPDTAELIPDPPVDTAEAAGLTKSPPPVLRFPLPLIRQAIEDWRDTEINALHEDALYRAPSEDAAREFARANEGLMQQLGRLARGKPPVNRKEERAPLPAFAPDGDRADWIKAMDGPQRNTLFAEHPDVMRFLHPPERVAEVEREVAEERARGLLRNWTGDVDAKLATILSARGMRVGPDYPPLRHVRPRFARAWLDVLEATERMLRSEPDLALLDPEGFGAPSKQPDEPDDRQRGGGRHEAPAWATLPFMMHFDDWTQKLKMEPRQLAQYRTDVQEFGEAHPTLPLGRVTHREGEAWVETLHKRGLSPKTIARKLSSIRNYWKYLAREYREQDFPERSPFHGLEMPLTSRQMRRGEIDATYLPFSVKDVSKLWREAVTREDQPLADLIRLAAFAGGRIESLCQIDRELVRTEPISGIRYFQFFDKSPAGEREVPVHPALDKQVDRLLRDRMGAPLIASPRPDDDVERSQPLGKRFGRMKNDMGHGKREVFHSIRKTFSGLLATVGLSSYEIGDIIGHDRKGVTERNYIPAVELPKKLAAITRGLIYPDDEFMQAP